VAQRTSVRTIALELLALIGLGLGLVISVLAGAGGDVIQLWLGLAAILFRLLGWWFRTYTVTEGEVLLDEGILQKRHRVVPFTRIQQVELRQQLLARFLGIAILQVETAGDAASTAVVLRYLELPRAEALRDHLLDQQRRARGGDRTRAPSEAGFPFGARAMEERAPLVRLRAGQLVVAGATSSRAVSLGVLTTVAAAVAVTAHGAATDLGPLVVAALWAGITVAALVTTSLVLALSTLVQSWAFELISVGDDLHVSFGLLDRRQHTIPRHRLQHVTVVDNPVRRRLGIVAVRLHSGATPGHTDGQASHIEIPAIPTGQLGDLLVRAMGDGRWRPPPLAARPLAARRRAVIRRSIPGVVLAAAGAVAWWPAGAALLPAALLGIPWGRLAHRRAGFWGEGDVLALASGALVHHLELVPRERVQSVRSSASPFQRRLQLSTLHVDVAGGSQLTLFPSVGLMDLDEGDVAAALAGASMPGRPPSSRPVPPLPV